MDGEQLNQVLTDHSLWLSSNGKQGKRACLSGSNLTGVDLSGADLTRANLSWANLHRANLSWADLSGADLTRANLSWANLTGANLTGAYLTGAYPRGANLTEVNLTDVDLHWADLTGAELGPQIRECLTFEGAQVSEDQLAWLCLHPLFGEWLYSLEVVPARDRNAHHVTLPGPGPSDARANPPPGVVPWGYGQRTTQAGPGRPLPLAQLRRATGEEGGPAQGEPDRCEPD